MSPLARAILTILLVVSLSSPHARADPGEVFYEAFVRSFQDSDGDGIGDLAGVTSRLDDLSYLGVRGLWLTPIFASGSYHGYDTIDYRAIQPELGSAADFDALVAAAHRRGIRVILDLALNHVSTRHPWFISASGGPGAPHRDAFCWKSTDPAWPATAGRWLRGTDRAGAPVGDYFFTRFGRGLADLNLLDPLVRAEARSVVRFWLARGVDGFRLDAPRYYVEGARGEFDTPATHAFLRELAADARRIKRDVLIVGEVWATARETAPYLSAGDELDVAFDFTTSGGISGSLQAGDAGAFTAGLRDVRAAIADPARLAPFLSNHDMVRISTQARRDPRALELAATALLTLPGTPFVYYGEEIGLPNGAAVGDVAERLPMQWSEGAGHGFTPAGRAPWAAFGADEPGMSFGFERGRAGSLLEAYRELIALRAREPALSRGTIEPIALGDDPMAAAYVRASGSERVLVVLNFGAKPIADLLVPLPTSRLRAARVELLRGEGTIGVRRVGARDYAEVPRLAGRGAIIARITP